MGPLDAPYIFLSQFMDCIDKARSNLGVGEDRALSGDRAIRMNFSNYRSM
jgi:hypothetical protein